VFNTEHTSKVGPLQLKGSECFSQKKRNEGELVYVPALCDFSDLKTKLMFCRVSILMSPSACEHLLPTSVKAL
jgi:hypothetical protein